MERDPLKVAVDVCSIIDAIEIHDCHGQKLNTAMTSAFSWWTFAEQHPDMTAEEIASAAADGFDVKGSV